MQDGPDLQAKHVGQKWGALSGRSLVAPPSLNLYRAEGLGTHGVALHAPVCPQVYHPGVAVWAPRVEVLQSAAADGNKKKTVHWLAGVVQVGGAI